MASRRDLVAEIEEVRARSRPGTYPVTIPFRMLRLASAFKSAPDLDPEFLRYVPIAAVACIEGFFRAAIRVFIDAGDEFIERASELSHTRELRVDFQILRAVHGRRITAGELVAHVLPMNNLAQIDCVMSTLIGRGFLSLVKVAHSRWSVEVKQEPLKPIIDDPAQAFRHVEEMFRLRHIYAHELVEFDRPNRDALAASLESSVAFLEASAEVIGNVLHPNAPLTQADMNERAASDLAAVEEQIDAVCARLLAKLEQHRQPRFVELQEAWKLFQKRYAEFEASEYKGGSIAPTIYASAAKAAAEDRLRDLRRSLDAVERES